MKIGFIGLGIMGKAMAVKDMTSMSWITIRSILTR